MSTQKNATDERDETWRDSQPTGKPSGETGTEDEQKWGKKFLIHGLGTVIARGRMLACLHPLSDDEDAALVEAWYEAIIGVVPCEYWKEVGLYASRYTKPADKFTLGQFFEAWEKFCEQGKARGYESWR